MKWVEVTLEINEHFLDGEWDEPEHKLAHMLAKQVIFTNNGWWLDGWPKDRTSIHVNCSDVFSWGCADAEDLPHSEISALYAMWRKDPTWGAAAWCIKKRKQRPQPPLEKLIKEAGIWDIDALIRGDQ